MIDLEGVDLFLPDGRPIVEVNHLVLAGGESVVLSGPSGSGKSTLFRAISGIWPYGRGRILSPEGIRVMVVPPKPYIPISTLRAAVTYPSVPGTYSDDDIRKALVDAHLGDLANQLDREEMWSQRLSSGEQQRLALARALLTRPDWLFLDESTSAVDEKLEAELYAVLALRLPKTTIMSIGHRSAVVGLHQRHLEMCPKHDRFTLRDVQRPRWGTIRTGELESVWQGGWLNAAVTGAEIALTAWLIAVTLDEKLYGPAEISCVRADLANPPMDP